MINAGWKERGNPERCPRTKHVDGKSHGWLFWGDDPYIKCDWCGEIRDALTGRVVTYRKGEGSEREDGEHEHTRSQRSRRTV